MIYRERYRKDKVIKGPVLLMKKIEEDEHAKKEYLLYLESSD
jgi:hypothetical protein